MAIRTVVVGYGLAGKLFHCYLVKREPGLVLHGVVSRDPATRERIVSEQSCRAYESLSEACADSDVGLVVIATPNGTHAELAIQAMKAGKHVVTDKVMCLSLAECDRMIEASRTAGVMLSVFQNRRFDGDFLTVQALAGGELGEMRWVEMAWQGPRSWGGWRGSAAMGGGRYFDLGAHLVDQACMLFPQAIERVYCRMVRESIDKAEREALVVIEFSGGATAVCDLSSMAFVSKPRFYVRGTAGTFVKHGLDPQETAMREGNIDSAREDSALFGTLKTDDGARIVPTLPGRWLSYYENIAMVLDGKSTPAVRLDQIRRQIAVLDAGLRSACDGCVVCSVAPGLEPTA